MAKPETRECLKCRKLIARRGPGQRLCGVCNAENQKLALRATQKPVPMEKPDRPQPPQ